MHAVNPGALRATIGRLGLGLGLLFLQAMVVACATPDASTACSEGTVFVEGHCIADVTRHVCGPGTRLQGTECVLDLTAIPGDSGGGDDVEAPGGDISPEDTGEPSPDVPSPDDDTVTLECPDGCPDGQLCEAGECRIPEEAPIEWFCIENLYADGFFCDCECGFPDPDCSDPALPVQGCEGAATCQPDGVCGECVPVCDGLACGSDGCGGSCGDCAGEGESCVDGQCKMCTPSCDGLECGDDGCGGSCGECDGILACFEGLCLPPEGDASCEGHCGEMAESGCWCTSDCETFGDCCADVEVCACDGACDGLECGDDGCGGTCGECGDGDMCQDGLCVLVPSCVDAGCHDHGDCDDASGDCVCDAGFAGSLCDECAPGHVGFPLCGVVCVTDSQCADDDDCTEDLCTTGFGCLNVRAPMACDDGNPCTSYDTCGEQGCVGIDDGCDDGNACTQDACSASGCVHSASSAATCDDHDPCTAVDTCSGTTCHGTGAVTCDDGSMCTVDACVPGEGCVYEPVPNDAPCDTGDNCVYLAACRDGVCTATRKRSCYDDDPCTADECAPDTGECSNPTIADGGACDDGQPCTVGETCGSGTCVPASAVCALPVAEPVAHYSAFSFGALELDETTGEVYGWFDEHYAGFVEADAGGELPTWEPTAVMGHPGVRFANGAALSAALPGSGTTPVSLFAVVCLETPNSPVNAMIASVAPDGQAPAWRARVGDGLVGSAGPDDGWLVAESRGCMVVSAEFGPGGETLALVSGAATESEVVGSVPLPSLTADDVLRIGGSTRPLVLGELLIYHEALDAEARVDVISTLRRAWGFPAPAADGTYDPDDAASVSFVDPPPFAGATLVQELDSTGDGPTLTCPTPLFFCPGLQSPNLYSANAAIGFYASPDAMPLQASAGALVDSAFTMVAAMRLDEPATDGVLVHLDVGDSSLELTQSWCNGCDGEVRWGNADDTDGGALMSWPIGTAQWHVVTVSTNATGECTVGLEDGGAQTAACPTPPAGEDGVLDVGSFEDPTSNPTEVLTRPMGGVIGELRFFTRPLHPLDRAYVERLIAWKYNLW